MCDKRPDYNVFLPAFFVIEYSLFWIVTAFFLLQVPTWNLSVCLLLIPALFFYPLLFIVPAVLLTSAVAVTTRSLAHKNAGLRRFLVGTAAFATTFIPHLLLTLDAGLYARYSYHINPPMRDSLSSFICKKNEKNMKISRR